MRKSVCAGQGERKLAPHCCQSAACFTLTFCSSRCPRQQVPIRAEKCEHIVLCPTHSPRCRWAVPLRLRPLQSLRFGECLIGSLVARTPRVSGSFGHYHCALHLNPAAKVLTPAAMARHSRRLQERIQLVLRCSPMLSQVCPATPVAGLGTLTAVIRLVLHSHSLQAQHSHCVRGCPCCELMTYSCAIAHLLPCLHFTAHRHRLITKSHQANLK